MPPSQFHSIQSQKGKATTYMLKGIASYNIVGGVPTGKSKSLEDSENTRREGESKEW